jgi:hypothetical protein
VDFPFKLAFASLYGAAFRYADLTQNEGRYAGRSRTRPTPDALMRYSRQVREGQIVPLDFTFYLPAGYESLGGIKVPNVEVAADTSRAFTVSFQNRKEIWNALP